MLTIYTKISEIPGEMKIVTDNDSYFNAKSKILDNMLVREILKQIDKASYATDITFIGRDIEQGNLNKIYLSTGSKTLINIINFDNICFDVCECGNNVLDLLPKLSCETDGFIYWKNYAYSFSENFECDIMFKGERFKRIFDYMNRVMEEMGNEDN